MSGYVTGTNNQLLEDGTYRYTYDKEGNRVEKYKDNNSNDTLDAGDTDVTLYDWDHRNRLSKIQIQANYGTTNTTIDYAYDVFDRRVFKDKGREVCWVWDGQQLALEFSFTGSLSYRFLYGPGVDQILTQGSVWHLGDHLGTTRDLVDEDGDHTQHFEFDSYGRLLNSVTFSTLLLFAGREYDTDTKMYYVRARWYDPNVGRWISEDPIGFAGGDTNLARYVGNSPVNYTDPSGLQVGGAIPGNPWNPNLDFYNRPVNPPYTPDEQRLLDLYKDDPEMQKEIKRLIDLIRSVHVWSLRTNYCHAWGDEFEKRYEEGEFPWEIDPQEPHYIGWNPGWTGHNVNIIHIGDEKVYIDNGWQGGAGRICFSDGLHKDLAYDGSEEYKQREKEIAEAWEEYYERQRRWREFMKDSPYRYR